MHSSPDQKNGEEETRNELSESSGAHKEGEQDEHEGSGHEESSEHEDHRSHHAAMVRDFRRRFWINLVLTLPVLALAPLIRSWLGVEKTWRFPGDSYVQFALATVIFVYGGWPFLSGLVRELRQKQPGMMTLIAMAITVAWGYSSLVVFGLQGSVFFWELATLIDVMLLGHWIEMRSVMGASSALEELVKLMPDQAHRLRDDGGTEDVATTELRPGDRVVVKPGEKVPIDGSIVEGRSTINEAMLTGESQPVEKGEGDRAIGGAVNGEAALQIEVERTGEDTYLSQVIALVREAQASRSRSQDLANRAALWLTVVALTAGAVTLAAWLVLGQSFNFALNRMVTVMVITCPHALGLAVPLVIAVSTAIAAGHGLLIRERTPFEGARRLQAIVFDKTGTLTEGRFGVSEVIALGNGGEDEILRLAASLESRSEHPIAAGIVAHAEEKGVSFPAPKDFEAIPGKGARGRVEGRPVKVVSPAYLEENDLAVEDGRVEEARKEGQTVVFVLVDDEVRGAVALADVVRSESREALDALREMGVRAMMLTGDAEAVAARVSRELGIEEYFAEVLPDHKAEKIKEVQARGLTVAMAGDGVNDAPALVQADLGVAIGAGTEVAIQSADVVLVRSDPRDVVTIVELARATYRKTVQNLLWATGYNLVAIPLAAGVLYAQGIVLSPAVGAMLMSLSTVIVAINARLLRLPSHAFRPSNGD